jgi:predicted DCC family thiol-disulfide oxidoreductase YuxK
MKALLRLLDRFWFAPAPAARLAAVRILVGGFGLWYFGSRYFLFARATGGEKEFYTPVGLATLLLEPLPVAVFQCLYMIMLLANVAFILGWRFRLTGPLYGVLTVFIMCYRNSWSMIYHSDNLLVLDILVLGLSRAADAFSLDSQARAPSAGASAEAPSSWLYGWPLRLVCGITVTAYFVAGVAKVAGPLGWSWAAGESLRGQLAADALRKEFLGNGASPLVFKLYGQTGLFGIIGVTTLIFELGAPLALLHRWVGYLWAVGALGMHWGIYFIMGITFDYSMSGIIFAAFFPVEWLLFRKASPSVVLYDGRCGLCQNSRRWAGRLDWLGRVTWVNFRDPQVRAAVPQLTDEQLDKEMWVITGDGRMLPGFEGWRRLLSGFPLTFVPSLLLSVPPIPRLGKRVYRFIAQRRRPSCEIAPPSSSAAGPWRAILQQAGQTAGPAGAGLAAEKLARH